MDKILNENEQKYYKTLYKVFDFLAPFYDVICLPITNVRKKLISMAKADADSSIIDIATGTGKQAFAFAKKGHSIIGVDLSEAMLNVAKPRDVYSKFVTSILKFTEPIHDNIEGKIPEMLSESGFTEISHNGYYKTAFGALTIYCGTK